MTMTAKPHTDERGDLPAEAPPPGKLDRRAMLAATGTAVLALLGYPLVRRLWQTPRPVFLARGQRYDGPLVQTIRDGLAAVEFDSAWVRGRRVLLKPNLVEPCRECPHLTTHPSLVLAAAEVFRDFGAEVVVGEGPGHVRDTQMALIESGMEEALRGEKLSFADLNYDDAPAVPNRGRTSKLAELFFPRSVLEADLIVSMPKLKTHHWVGMTASMKNLYGTLPGLIYGWPKNVLHYAGIPQTVVDINASLPRSIAIVDAILCMEGDGPIMGTPKPMGLVAVGLNPTAVDATCSRIIGIDPGRIDYLRLAAGKLGPIAARDIPQRGEPWEDLVDPFAIVDVPHLRHLRG
jgi:uncharacterized protein (DUF362 family)